MKRAVSINTGLDIVSKCVWPHPAEILDSSEDERKRTRVSRAFT